VLVAPPPSLLRAGALREIAKPTLILTGAHDALAPAAALAAEIEGAPLARLEVVPEADHFFVAGLAALSRLVLDWLRDTQSAAA